MDNNNELDALKTVVFGNERLGILPLNKRMSNMEASLVSVIKLFL